MPELPEAEVVRRQLQDGLVGTSIKDIWTGRPDIIRSGLDTLDWYRHARILAVERHGKSVVLTCRREGETRYLLAELGMTGLLLFGQVDVPHPQHVHCILTLQGGLEDELRYWNPRRFGRIHLLDPAGLSRLMARRFGADPLTISWDDFLSLVRRRRGRLKTLLMHQQVIAGIGNIYANEILHRARLHPHRIASRLRSATVRRLYEAMRLVLQEGIQHGGSSVRDFMAPDGARGGFQAHHRVYNRARHPCPTCSSARIRHLTGERSSYYCPACQPR